MAFSAIKMFDGPRNAVVVVKADTTVASLVIAQANLMTPPCRTFSVRRIIYDVGTGNLAAIYFGTVAPEPITTLSPGNGQTMDFNNFGGTHNENPAVNGILSAGITVTGGDGVSFTVELVKKY